MRAQASSSALLASGRNPSRPGSAGFLPQQFPQFERTLRLTNFFNLSNIAPVAWRSSGMARASQCFRKLFFQPDGPQTLTAAELIPYTRKPLSSCFAADRAALPLAMRPRKLRHSPAADFRSVTWHAWRVRRRYVLVLRPLPRFRELPSEATRESNSGNILWEGSRRCCR